MPACWSWPSSSASTSKRRRTGDGVESAPQDLDGDRAGRVILMRRVHDTRAAGSRAPAGPGNHRGVEPGCNGHWMAGRMSAGSCCGIEEGPRAAASSDDEERFHGAPQERVGCRSGHRGARGGRRDGPPRARGRWLRPRATRFTRVYPGGGSTIGPRAWYNQARANAHSFLTVAGDRSRAAAVSSIREAGEIPQRDDLRFAGVETARR